MEWTIQDFGAAGEFVSSFVVLATLIYLSIQVRHTRNESAHAVLEARATGIREIHLAAATSDSLSAAMTKAYEAMETPMQPFNAALVARGLDYQEAQRVWRFFFAQWILHSTQYQTASAEQRGALDRGFRAVYTTGLGRLFWDNFYGPDAQQPTKQVAAFEEHMNRLIAIVDQET